MNINPYPYGCNGGNVTIVTVGGATYMIGGVGSFEKASAVGCRAIDNEGTGGATRNPGNPPPPGSFRSIERPSILKIYKSPIVATVAQSTA